MNIVFNSVKSVMRRIKQKTSLFFVALLIISTPILAIDLQDIQYGTLPNNQIQIQLKLSGPIEKPQTFSTDSPARIAIDLPGVSSKLASKSIQINLWPIYSLVAVEASEKTRVVLNLIDPVSYEVSTNGDQITILLASQGRVATTSPSVVGGTQQNQKAAQDRDEVRTWSQNSRSQKTAAKEPDLRNIDFRGDSTPGKGKVEIKLPTADTRVAVRREASNVYIDLYHTSLPKQLYRRLDVRDFGSPVTFVDARSKGDNVEVAVETQGDFDYMAYQVDDLFTLEFRTLTPAELDEVARNKVVYEGERLSLNFQNIAVRTAFHLLADVSGLNIVVNDSVDGDITLLLKDVPWDQALDIILKAKGLAKRQSGNVIMIANAKELAQNEQSEMEAFQKIEELSPLRTELIKIKYAKASEIVAVIMGTGQQKMVSSLAAKSKSNTALAGVYASSDVRSGVRVRGGGQSQYSSEYSSQIENSGGILSFRGSITADERTNTLIVQDTVASIEKIRNLVNTLDVPVKQVMIESRVVIASSTFARDLGVRFGISGSAGTFGGNEILVGGGQNGALAVGDYDSGPFGLNTATGSRYNSTLTDNNGNASLITNLPAASPSGSIDFLIGKVGSYLLQLELSAMQKEGLGEIVSNPRVITSDKTPANIRVGQQVPYQSTDDRGNPTTVFQNAALELNVLPQITPDETIIMDLEVSKNAVDYTRPTEAGYPIDERSVKTSVLVNNGETVVLGGVFERTKSFSKKQVPWLGDIPVVGRLFKKESKMDENSELLIFVTPKILSDTKTHP